MRDKLSREILKNESTNFTTFSGASSASQRESNRSCSKIWGFLNKNFYFPYLHGLLLN